MIISSSCLMSSYKKRKFNNFNDFFADIADTKDRKLMKEALVPLMKELMDNNIYCPHNFVDILKRFNIPGTVIKDFMQKNNLSEISNRILSKSNSFEKNTILTHQSLKTGDLLYDKFKSYISEAYEYFGNKENLFEQIRKEINKIQEKSLKNPNSFTELVSDDLEMIYDGYYEDFGEDFFSYNNYLELKE